MLFGILTGMAQSSACWTANFTLGMADPHLSETKHV